MRCEKCGGKAKVIATRETNNAIRRRRECQECGLRFTTFEISRIKYEILDNVAETLKKEGIIS
ncbi:MAG: hypothetical protein ACOCT9_01630 [archaeon]